MAPRRFSFSELHDRRAAWLGEDVLVDGHVYGTH
jgi:hypothetical protein